MSSKSRNPPLLEKPATDLDVILNEFQDFLDQKRKNKELKRSYDVNLYREELVNHLLKDLLDDRNQFVNGAPSPEPGPSTAASISTVISVKDEPLDLALVNGNSEEVTSTEESLFKFLKSTKASSSSSVEGEGDEMPELEPATEDDPMPQLEAQFPNDNDSDEDDITNGDYELHNLALNLFAASDKKVGSRRDASSSDDDRQRTKLPKYRERKSTSFVPNNEEVAEKEDAEDESPNWPYAFMISIALLENEATETRSIHDIYRFVEENFPFYRTSTMNWRDCVRSSLKAYFRKPYNTVPSRNPLYTFNDEKKEALFVKLAEFLQNENTKKAAENYDYIESILVRARILKKKAPKRACRDAPKNLAEVLEEVEQVEKRTTKRTRK